MGRKFYSPFHEHPAARRRHSGFGASATCCSEAEIPLSGAAESGIFQKKQVIVFGTINS